MIFAFNVYILYESLENELREVFRCNAISLPNGNSQAMRWIMANDAMDKDYISFYRETERMLPKKVPSVMKLFCDYTVDYTDRHEAILSHGLEYLGKYIGESKSNRYGVIRLYRIGKYIYRYSWLKRSKKYDNVIRVVCMKRVDEDIRLFTKVPETASGKYYYKSYTTDEETLSKRQEVAKRSSNKKFAIYERNKTIENMKKAAEKIAEFEKNKIIKKIIV